MRIRISNCFSAAIDTKPIDSMLAQLESVGDDSNKL